MSTDKKHAKRVLWVYALGVGLVVLISLTPFVIPCLWKLLTGIPCPACGITRSFMLAGQFQFLAAIRMNILFLPLALGMIGYFFAALAELFLDKPAIGHLNAFLAKWWVIALAILLMAASWYYNIARGI